MIDILANVNKQECSACGACINACPIDAITLVRDEYGFEYPQINESICVSCGKCASVCKKFQSSELTLPIKCFAGSNKDKQILKKSASGGAFSALAEYVLSKSGAVCGCVYDKNLIPIHICSENEEDVVCIGNFHQFVELIHVQRNALFAKNVMTVFQAKLCIFKMAGGGGCDVDDVDVAVCHQFLIAAVGFFKAIARLRRLCAVDASGGNGVRVCAFHIQQCGDEFFCDASGAHHCPVDFFHGNFLLILPLGAVYFPGTCGK